MFLILLTVVPRLILLKILFFNEGRTRGANSRNFVIPGHNHCSKNSFTYCAIKDWNKLPTNIKSCNIKATFKQLVKNFLKGEARTSAEQVYLYY